jgi:hypothetical protein
MFVGLEDLAAVPIDALAERLGLTNEAGGAPPMGRKTSRSTYAKDSHGADVALKDGRKCSSDKGILPSRDAAEVC